MMVHDPDLIKTGDNCLVAALNVVAFDIEKVAASHEIIMAVKMPLCLIALVECSCLRVTFD